MTNQEVYDTVKAHLIKQNAKSRHEVIGEGTCLYRDFEGRKCAAGIFIPYDKYTPEMEGKRVTVLVQEKLFNFDGIDLDLLSSLQRVHDNDDVESWSTALAEVAIDFGLNP
jgi:hypothetical protein